VKETSKSALTSGICGSALKSVAVLLVLVGIFEAVLRFGLGLGNPVLIAPDSACGYILKPDQNVLRFFSHTHVNHYGMRSAEVASTRDPHTLRIMFVGDSVTYGTSRVDQQQIFTEILHRDLPAILHQPVEVLNASASAWAIDNELSYIRSRGLFHSDTVLLVLNDGDVTQSRATMAEVRDDLPQKRPPTAIGELYERYVRPRLFSALMRTDAGDGVAANADGTIRQNMADLDALEALVTGQGARLVIIYAPFRGDAPNQSANAQAVLRNWTASHQVAMFDLTSVELHYSSREITLDNIHFNAKGHRVVAEAIEKEWPELMGVDLPGARR
jgi:hypothetical protein